MRLPTFVLFTLSAVSFALGQNGTGSANDALVLVSNCNRELQSSPAGDIAPKLASMAAELQSLGSSLPADPSTTSQIAVQAASIVSRVANQGMTVGPDGLGGDVQGALKGFLEGVEGCVEGVGKEISRMLVDVSVQVFLKNNAGGAMAVLSQAERKAPVVVATANIGTGGITLKVGGTSVSAEL